MAIGESILTVLFILVIVFVVTPLALYIWGNMLTAGIMAALNKFRNKKESHE